MNKFNCTLHHFTLAITLRDKTNKPLCSLSVFLLILLLTSVGVTGEGKGKKNVPFDLWGKGKKELCHITGVYDFGQGKVPIGHVIKVPEPAYLSRIKKGDIGGWDVANLPNGQKVCFESTDVCHIDEMVYDFGEGNVPIGMITKIPASYYQNHIAHSDPERYKIVNLPEGSEVCLARGGEETQFSKGIALFGYDAEISSAFIQHLNPGKLGAELSRRYYYDFYDAMTSFYIEGKQYVMGINSSKEDEGYWFFIQQILSSGDFGPITDSGYFQIYYKTLIAVTTAGGEVYMFGQEDGGSNRASVKRLLSGGRLGPETWKNYWNTYFDTATALPSSNGHTSFFIHDSHDDNSWYTKRITAGEEYVKDSGHWKHGYQVVNAYRADGQTYLFGHRHRYDWRSVTYRGPWFIQKLTDNNSMSSESDSGEWDHYWASITVFRHPENNRFYLFGHNTDENWFIQHVTYAGQMGAETDSGKWKNYYKHLFPVDLDESYLGTDNWMARMFEEIPGFGGRKLHEIALPGSHDSGMNGDDVTGCQLGGNKCNTVTQYGDIEYQLDKGARYFDIRPMVDIDETGYNWTTGHAAKLGTDLTAGCRGEDKIGLVADLDSFLDDHPKELVILKVSHCMTPPGNGYADCTGDQVEEVATQLAADLEDHVVKCEDCNLTDMTLDEILELGNIIIVVTSGVRDRAEGVFAWGYGGGSDYYVIDEYSNTEDFSVMSKDQIDKLLDSGNHTRNDKLFLLSWTLTLSSFDAAFCSLSILDYAETAQPRIFEYIYQLVEEGKITKTLFPNVLYVDAVKRTQTNAAVYLNKVWDDLDP